MATQPQNVSNITDGTQAGQTPAKAKRRRSSPLARPAYVIVQVLDESGQPAAFDKKRIKILSVERSADKVLEAVEGGTYPNAFYLLVTVPPSGRASPATAPAPKPAAA